MDSASEAAGIDQAKAGENYIPNFGDDELGKLQNILLGDHARRNAERIDTLEQALLGVVDDLRSELQEQVARIESRIEAEADTRATAVSNVSSRVDEEAASRAGALKDLTADLRATETDMQTAIDSASSGLSDHVDQLRAATESTTADLSASKVDRAALAQLLSAAVDGLADQPADDD